MTTATLVLLSDTQEKLSRVLTFEVIGGDVKYEVGTQYICDFHIDGSIPDAPPEQEEIDEPMNLGRATLVATDKGSRVKGAVRAELSADDLVG